MVCTEETQIHHSSDQTPHIEGRFWDDNDIPSMQIMVEAVHKHGALAGLEIAYHGLDASNLYSRVPSMSANSMALWGATGHQPGQSCCMDKEDIRNVRR